MGLAPDAIAVAAPVAINRPFETELQERHLPEGHARILRHR
jgi:hypothetical protein